MFKRSIITLMAISVSGCGIAPGMKMKSPPPSVVSYSEGENRVNPTFVPITASLLEKMKDDRSANSDIYDYYVGPHDILSISVWNHPEFNSPNGQMAAFTGPNTETLATSAPVGFLVDSSGNVFFPLVGSMHVAGKTVNEIRREISFSLRKYIRKPQLTVSVTGFRNRKVYVMGEVHKEGIQPITDIPLTLTDAISLAGGLNVDSADPSHIYVIRGNISRPTVYWLNAQSPDAMILATHFALKNRDIVFASTAGVARWNRAINLILPTLQTAWFTQAFIKQSS